MNVQVISQKVSRIGEEQKTELEHILALAIGREKEDATCREIAWRLEAVLIGIGQGISA